MQENASALRGGEAGASGEVEIEHEGHSVKLNQLLSHRVVLNFTRHVDERKKILTISDEETTVHDFV